MIDEVKRMVDWLVSKLGLPINASAHGYDIDFMIGLVHVLMLALFVGWGIYFIFVLFRFNRHLHPKANYTGVKHHLSSYVEAGVAIFEAVLLVGFAFPVWAKVTQQLPLKNQAVEVRVVAEQFAWNIHYPGPDGIFGRGDPKKIDPGNPIGLDSSDPAANDDIVVINQLHLPVDKPVLIHLSSKDVIHSFFLPEMRVKQDAIPGMSIPVSFIPKIAGNYEIACAQLCGLGHYRMRGFLTIHTPEDFQKWLSEQTPLGASAGEKGESEYE